MPKEYSVDLAGKTRVLKYTRKERVEIEQRFNCDLRTFIYEKAFPLGADNKPTGGGVLVAQEALLYYGLRHAGPKVTEERVSEWLQQEAETTKRPFITIVVQAVLALLSSGVLGFTPNLESEEDDEGKEQAAEKPAAE